MIYPHDKMELLDNIYQGGQSLGTAIIISQNCRNASAGSIFSEKRAAPSKQGLSNRAIARELKCSPTTIENELRRPKQHFLKGKMYLSVFVRCFLGIFIQFSFHLLQKEGLPQMIFSNHFGTAPFCHITICPSRIFIAVCTIFAPVSILRF